MGSAPPRPDMPSAAAGISSFSPGHALSRPPPPLPRPCAMVDFLDYLKFSLSSGEVKLLFAVDQLRKSPGSDGAKLVATKAKGLPRITISLHSVSGAATSDAIAEFSLLLYGAYKTARELASKEQEQMTQLMGSLLTERDMYEQDMDSCESLDRGDDDMSKQDMYKEKRDPCELPDRAERDSDEDGSSSRKKKHALNDPKKAI